MRWRSVVGAVAVSAVWVLWLALCWRDAGLALPDATVQLRDRHGAFLGEVGQGDDERLGFWRLEEVPPRVAAATLALEDRRFASHPGVDPLAVGRAVWGNLRAGRRTSGASTLAMQVARLQRPGRRTWGRKLREAFTALFLVDRHGRDEVLAHYLTLAPYGNNVHGIAYAARRYFDKPVADLSWAEVALLTAVPQAPGRRNLYTHAGRRSAVARAEIILGQLRDDEQLSETDHRTALRQLLGLVPPPRPERPPEALHLVLALQEQLGTTRPEGGLVHTSLDVQLQRRALQALAEAVARWRQRGAGNAAAVIVDLASRSVRARVGSSDWGADETRGAIDYSRTERSPGSTLKPFLFARALDQGLITPGTPLDDLARGPDGIGNADGSFLGRVLPRVALGNSRNVPAVALARDLGLHATYGLFEELGLHRSALPAEHYGLGVAIGGMPTTLMQLATAYTALATDGRLRPLVLQRGAPIAEGERVVSEAAARWTALALSDPLARLPTFPRMGHSEYPYGVAVKTGTSPDFRDAWAVVFSDRHLVAVWVGHPDWLPMQQLSGYRAGASLAQTLLQLVEPERGAGRADRGLPAPEGWRSVEVCSLSGARAHEDCASTLTEVFPPGQVPEVPCAVHRREGTAVVVDLPPRFAAWQRQQGHRMPTRSELQTTAATLRITAPVDGAEIRPDPHVPASRSTVRLAVDVTPRVDAVLWVVDGVPFAVAEPPYEVRWPTSAGEHTVEVSVPHRPERAAPVTIHVK
ncbi:MAG: transglycosylase domain-containing protein [Myxococcales bacterium]|nr:transglycosylase domain-containing protein [Myxococcales bacterium]